ncbi:hypothetical protein ACLQ18_27595 [Streptomyces sp. DT193]|uniref:hypothetical protein n=1 Tax=Streptomyces sp. DT193 TaxID=3393418 RepID=UPI003CEE5522
MRRSTGVVLGVVLLLPLAACGSGPVADRKSSLTAPEVFYLRPRGDKAGPKDKVPFHVEAEDVGAIRTSLARDHRLTVDVRGSEGVVRLRTVGSPTNPRCHGGTVQVTCKVRGGYDSWSDQDRVYPTPAKGSRPGDTGVVRFTFTTKDGKRMTTSTRVVVGEPVVKVRALKVIDDVRPGADVTVPLVVRNDGEVPVKGLALKIVAGSLDFRQRYANCLYPPQSQGHTAVCRFPGLRIPPGGAVVLNPALRLRAPKTRTYTSFDLEAWPLDSGPGQYSAVPPGGDHGDGPVLKAEAKAARDTDGTFAEGRSVTDVRLDIHADYEVFGVELHGSPGTERSLRLKVRNNGPGNPGSGTRLVFTPPPGAVLKEPTRVVDEDVHEPYCDSADGTYSCRLDELEPGESRDFEFTLRLDGPGEGSVTLQDAGLSTSRRDANPGNDTAAVTVLP